MDYSDFVNRAANSVFRKILRAKCLESPSPLQENVEYGIPCGQKKGPLIERALHCKCVNDYRVLLPFRGLRSANAGAEVPANLALSAALGDVVEERLVFGCIGVFRVNQAQFALARGFEFAG